MNDKLVLSNIIKIVDLKGVKSKQPFMQGIREGDYIEISTEVGYIGKYAQYYTIKNLQTRMEADVGGGILGNLLKKIEYEY